MFSKEQIVKILAEQREGKKVKDIARSHGISEIPEKPGKLWTMDFVSDSQGCTPDHR